MAPLERTCFLDHCSDAHLKVWEGNVAVHKRGMELIRPGIKCSEIAQELNELYAQLGLLKYRTFGYGHSFGVMSHHYGREAGKSTITPSCPPECRKHATQFFYIYGLP